jgi:hypothetical protein
MPDWRAIVRTRLAAFNLDPLDELSIVEEMAQHIEDRRRDLLSGGLTEAEADELARRERDDDGLGDLSKP